MKLPITIILFLVMICALLKEEGVLRMVFGIYRSYFGGQYIHLNRFDFNSSKKILYFNKFNSMDSKFGFGNEPFVLNNCTQQNCFATSDHKLLNSLADFDAILFHGRDSEFHKAPQVGKVSLK